jgi:hypothetical protein
MRFREFKFETIDPNKISNADSLGPGEELVKPKSAEKKIPLYPKVGFQVKVPANQYISNEVADIQQVLIALGYNIGKTGPKRDGVDGVNGQLTRAAIGKFQDDQNITVDRKIGPETVAALNRVIADRQLHLAHSDIDPHAKRVLDKANANDNGAKLTAGDIADIHDETFKEKLIKVADNLRIAPAALWKVIKFESHGNPTQDNTSKRPTQATGLIQFTPDTASGMGYTVGDIKKMSAVDQLDLVYQFYKGIKPGSSAEQLYLKTILPAFAYKDNDFVVGKEGAKKEFLPGVSKFSLHDFWDQNPVFRNGKPQDEKHIVTIGDIKKTFNAFKG